MYIYKLHQRDVLSVQGEFNHVATEGEWLYVESKTKLKAPFIEAERAGAFREEEEAKLKELKEAKIRALKEAREAKREDFTSEGLGEVHHYRFLDVSALAYLNAGILAMDKIKILCKKEDGEYIEAVHTKTQAKDVLTSFLKNEEALNKRLNDVLTAVKNAKNREEIEAISL